MARRKSGGWAPHLVLGRVFLGPDLLRAIRGAFRTKEIASASRDQRTGTVKTRGMRRTADGWQLTKTRKTRTYRAGEVDQPRAARSKARADNRKAARTARAPRATAKPAAAKSTNPNLARKSRQRADGTMAGSIEGLSRMPTPRQATGLQRLGCDWCRGRGVRPLTVGKGRIRTVIGVARCSHSWAVPNNGPGQDAPKRGDALVCTTCENKGKVPVVARGAGGVEVTAEVPCTTCQGWILYW